jgi:hypothetical protein
MREQLRSEGTILKEIRETNDLSDELAARLDAELQKFEQVFNVEEETGLAF